VSDSTEAATLATPSAPVPTWGLGDVAIGVVLILFVPTVVVGIAIAAFDIGEQEYDDLALWAVALLQLPLWAVFVGVPWWATKRKGSGSLRIDFGFWQRWKDIPIGLGYGVLGQFAIVLLVPLYDLLGIDENDVGQAAEEMSDRAHDPVGVICLFLVAVVGAAVFEELFYRGLVLRSVRRRFGNVVGIIGTSLLFGVMHFQFFDTIALTLVGALFAWLAIRYDRLGPAIWAHMAFNLTAFLALLAS
jgi:uncharacterized protein